MYAPPAARNLVRRAASRRVLLDVAVGAALASAVLIAVVAGRPDGRPGATGRPLRTLDVVVAGAVFVLVAVRRWRPLVVLGVAATLAVVAAGSENVSGPFIMATAVAAYTVATRTDRRTAWLTCGGAALASYLATVVLSEEDWFGPALGVIAWIGMTTAVGDATRIRRAYVAAVEERAVRAERTREEEARRRVAEERLRIARDLHDAVAHHIAVVNLHAGLAGHTLRTRPDQAEASLVHVRDAAQTVLDELATILSVLRQNGDDGAPTDPVRGLDRLDDLLTSLAAAGHRVEHRRVGVARPLPEAVDQAAYRIVQEALTNAHKHGVDDSADLRIEYRPDAVVLDITNPTGPERRDTGGHGLTGMRERATAVGGTLTAQPSGPTRFRVHAVLPASS
ncbi:sensor histidine kinase [Virgisporangium aurantiacum]|uniref:histidine kinase n=1 Tax=Virgisporangium aurantiacum TaxID=175570 RepID=A0A8J3ZDQ7_9ACTN|nr:histidine kinase [Virgisporangium aurantiacum]GIJ61012.1 two-component sensor histidine kinase [Virgisporangium aurantiacum]